MLKIGGQGERNGKPVRFMLIGLSHANLARLKEGQPIHCTGADFGLDGAIDILIFSGETEQSMRREFADMIGPQTRVKIDPRTID